MKTGKTLGELILDIRTTEESVIIQVDKEIFVFISNYFTTILTQLANSKSKKD